MKIELLKSKEWSYQKNGFWHRILLFFDNGFSQQKGGPGNSECSMKLHVLMYSLKFCFIIVKFELIRGIIFPFSLVLFAVGIMLR